MLPVPGQGQPTGRARARPTWTPAAELDLDHPLEELELGRRCGTLVQRPIDLLDPYLVGLVASAVDELRRFEQLFKREAPALDVVTWEDEGARHQCSRLI